MTKSAYDMYFKEAVLKYLSGVHEVNITHVKTCKIDNIKGQIYKMLFLTQIMQIVKLAIGMSNKFLEETKEKCKKNC